MIRNLFRILILGFGAFLAYSWVNHKLELVGLLSIYVVLFLIYLATYVKTIKQVNKDDGLPPLMEEDNLINSVKSYYESNVLFRNVFNRGNVFYPWGALGKGYYVPDISKQEETKNFLMLYSGITGALISIGILAGLGNSKWLSGFMLLPITLLWYRIKIAKLMRGLEVINIGSEHYSPPTINKHYRRLFVVMLTLGGVGGIGDIYNKGFSTNAFLMVVCSSAFLVLYAYFTWIRK